MQTTPGPQADPPFASADRFIARWAAAGGTELANAQAFMIELCDLLGVPRPEPAREEASDNAYVFERAVTFRHGDGSASAGRIDCYKRGAFVLEAKKVRQGGAPIRASRAFDDALLRARSQAEAYARALPASEGRPPFLVIVDVGRVIELYAEFTRSGATYIPFPDARSHRIELAHLADAGARERLARLWTDPLSLDPARASAKVTRDVSTQLAELAKTLEGAGHSAEHVAAFLTRCLFSMFAEDVGLLPKSSDGGGAFVHLLHRHGDDPETLRAMLAVLWADMDRGGFSAAVAGKLLRFNGKLFKGAGQANYVLPLDAAQIALLLKAASANWKEVEPAIFGTLLERALDPTERHALGAHYTPRAYVERLVLPTVVEPLRADWANAQAAALLLATEANALEGKDRDKKLAEARAEVKRFHHQLCTTRVLDPACGSGNFLYVTLEHLKRLETEVLNQLHALGESQSRLGFEGETVTPQQLRGIEVNERAAALAELVLWIGYLQWHIRSFGDTSVAEPVIHDYGNIEHRDAVLAWDRIEPMTDASGQVVTRWNGTTTKAHPVTGEPVPDDRALVPKWRYVNPRPAEWPQADFIVGNPPFIGAKYVRESLGDGYAEALRSTWPEVPESADFVMYWWQRAAEMLRDGRTRQFGLITTNSLRQIFNRRVVESQQAATPPLRLTFVVPDHPWVDGAGNAAVRIGMTVGTLASSANEGRLLTVRNEEALPHGEVAVELEERHGFVHADLRIGANLAAAVPLMANSRLSSPGVKLHGAGFIVTRADAAVLGLGTVPELERHIREYRNGRDLTATARDALAIDLFGLSADKVRERFPAVFQWLLDRVKPEREQNNRATYREGWWLFGEPRRDLRPALAHLDRYVATVVTTKHRVFQFLDATVLADDAIICVASNSALLLGVLSSNAHVHWALQTGSTLEDRPRYIKSACFETFPFPSDDTGLTPDLTTRIGTLAEQLDAHRKAQQAAHADLTLTGMYNVLEKLRRSEPLTAKDKVIHEHGLVSVLKSLHDELDTAVLKAYGWGDLAAPLADHGHAEVRAAAVDTLLERLVALNARRAAEEASGTVRWLRPEFQNPTAVPAGRSAEQGRLELEDDPANTDTTVDVTAVTSSAARRPWPSSLPEQIKAVAELLATAPRPQTQAEIETRFTGRGVWRKRLPTILQTLEAIGRAERSATDRWRST